MLTLPSLPERMNSRRLDDVLATAPLRTHLHDALVALGRLEHGAAFVNGLGQRLLDIDVLAGLAGEDGRQGVPVVGRGDEHHVHVLAVEDAAEVLHRVGLLAALLLANLDALGDPRVVHVADDDAIDFGVEEEAFEVALAHAAAADEPEPDLLVGPGLGGIRAAGQHGSQAAQGQGRQAARHRGLA